MPSKPGTLTTTSGNPVVENQHSITAGPRRPLIMKDEQLPGKLAHPNRARIPERTVHANGSAVYSTSTIPHEITKYSTVINS